MQEKCQLPGLATAANGNLTRSSEKPEARRPSLLRRWASPSTVPCRPQRPDHEKPQCMTHAAGIGSSHASLVWVCLN